MEKPHRLRIKHDLLGIDAELRSTRPLSERDVFDVLKKQDPNLPGQLLKKYRIQREKKFPDQELLSRYETAGLKAMENGFFETEGSFVEGFAEGTKMIARGARRVPISRNLSDNLRAISDNDLGGDPMKYAGDQWRDAVEKSAQQLYGLAQTDKALELGLPIASQVRDLHPIARMGTSVAQYFSDFDKNMDKALAFGGLPNDPSAKRIVMNRVLELDERKSDATFGQTFLGDIPGGLALLGEAGLKLIKKNPVNPLDVGIKTAIVKATGDNLKDFDRRAELDYLANQDHIIRGMEEGAEIAAQVGTQLSKAIGDESFVQRKLGDLAEFPFGGAETLTDIKTGAVQPDRDQAMAMSLVMSPDVPLTLGASGGLSVARNTVARGMIIGLSRKATLENSAKTALRQFKDMQTSATRKASATLPNAVQKQLIARAEKVLRENAGAQQKLNQVVNKNKAIGERIGIEQGVTKSGNYNQLGQRVQEALARTTGPEASITRRVTGKALEKAGISTETLGKAIEAVHRVPEEALVNFMTTRMGMGIEESIALAQKISFRGRALVAGGFALSNMDMDVDVMDAVGLMLLTPGGYKLLTRAGSDMAILGRQLQYAKASSPLFQRLAQMDPANPSLSEVTIDRTSALTVPMADVAGQVMSSGRNFGISPMLKGPSTFLTRTGLGNTLESAASTAKTATYASMFPLAFGYAVGGEEGAGMGLGASLFPLTIGMGVGHFAQVNSKFDLAQKLAGDEVIYKDSLDATSKPIFESMPKQVRQAIATGQMQNPDVIIDFKKGRGNSSYQVVDGESQITIYEKSNPSEIMQAVMGHEIAHHIDKFGYSTLIQEQLLGSVEKNKPGIFTEFDKDGKPIIITDPDGTKSYKTNKEFSATHEDVKSGRAKKIGHRQVYLDKLEASGYGPGTREYAYYKDSNSEIAREIFASHGAAEFFGGKFVKANYEGAGSKLVRSLARPIFNSNGMRNFFHRIGLASNERGLVADPTKLMPGLKEIPELTDMIRKYNSEMRGLDSEGRRAWAQRSGNLVDKDFADEFASAKLTAKDLENPAIVERLKAGGHVKIKDDGSLDTDASGRPVFLPTREVNKRNKNLSNDILDILRKKQGQLKEGHVELETTATGAERASGGFLGADIIAALKKQNRYNPHQLDALGAISRSIEAGGGDAWDLFYYSALKWNKAGRKVYGQIKGGDRLSIPFGIEISKDGNILINTISVDQFRNNLKYFATSNKFKQKFAQAFNAANEYEATRAAFRALPLYLENQRNNVPNDGTNGVTVAQRDFINAALGSVNQEQVVKNPILDAMGKNKRNRSVAIRSRRLDRIGQATQSPGSFGNYDPNKVSQNLMPQMELDFSPPKAAQSPEAKPNFWKIYRIDPKGPRVYDEVADVLIQVGSPWMDGSIIESKAPILRLEKGKLRQAMNRAHRRADRGGGKQFMPASEAGAGKGKVAEAAKLWNEKGTDSPYFKNWFGKSKVVDENGEPLVVYRGLDKTDQTDLSKGRGAKGALDGVHFSDDISYAQTYETEEGQTYPVYLQIKKPLDLRNIKSGNDLIGRFEKAKIPLSLKVNPFQWSQNSKFNVTAPLKYHLDQTIKNVEDIGGFVDDNFNPNMDLTDNLGRFVKDYVDGIIFNEHGGESVSYIAFSPEQIKSATGNRGTFDAKEGNILFMPSPGDTTPSSVQSWDGPNPTFATKLTKGMAKDNKEIAALLRQTYEDTFGEPLKAKDFSDTEVTWLADMLATEGEAALGRTGNAVDWYTSAVERALSVAEEIFPDIGKKFEAKDRFLGALSITSQNMKVLDNAKASVMQYEHKLRTGKFNYKVKHGEKGKAITKNLRMYDEIEAKMGIDDFHNFLDEDFTVKELSEWGKKFFNNKKFSIAGYQTDKVKGSAVFGPKIGQGFFQNLRGNYDPVTVDLWLRRTYGRLTGLALDTALTPKDIGKVVYSVRKNVGKRKFAGLELPDFLQGVRITGNLQKDGKANFRISDKSFESLFGDNTLGRDNTEAIFEFAEKLNREWERNFAKAGNDVKKAKDAIRKAKKKGKGVVNLEKKLAKLEVEKEAIGNEKPQWAKAGSTITDKLKPIDVPSNAERAVITKAFNEALEQLRAKGINLTPADLQATLWYPEKDIWAYLKGRDSNALNMSYDTAMEMIRDQRK